MWYQNLLLPCLILRILYSLVRRRLWPYPTLAELRDHRRQVIRANEFSEQISDRLSASSTFGMKEIWRLIKVFNSAKKKKVKGYAKDMVEHTTEVPHDDTHTDPQDDAPEAAIVLDDTKDSADAKDFKRAGLHVLGEIADLHERIKKYAPPTEGIEVADLASAYFYGVGPSLLDSMAEYTFFVNVFCRC